MYLNCRARDWGSWGAGNVRMYGDGAETFLLALLPAGEGTPAPSTIYVYLKTCLYRTKIKVACCRHYCYITKSITLFFGDSSDIPDI